jgi:hypothetical protein
MKTRKDIWIGARIELPDPGTPHTGYAQFWLDPEQGVVGVEVKEDVTKADLGRHLADACRQPMVGAPRRPARVRVESHALAAEIERAKLGVVIEVGPTPEMDDLIEDLAEFSGIRGTAPPAPPAHDFVGRPWRAASPADLAAATRAGARFLAARPWEKVDVDDIIEVQAPSLGLSRGVALVVGQMRTSFGFALFPSTPGLRTFLRLAEQTAYRAGQEHLDHEQLLFDITPGRRGQPPEVAAHHMLVDWETVPQSASEVQLCTAVAEAFAAFDPRSGHASVGPVTLSFAEPAPVVPLRPAPPSAAMRPSETARPERNGPCWCGSGKKYKKCHLDADATGARANAPSQVSGRSRWGAVLDRMYPRIVAWARKIPGWEAHMADVLEDVHPDLAMHHAIFALPFYRSGETVGQAFRAAKGAELGGDERRWLDANIDNAWTSYWSVVDTEPGRSMTLRDVFSEEVRTVIEASGSRTLVRHDILCARVVTVDDESYIDVVHPNVLGPEDAVYLRDRLAKPLGLTKVKAVPVAKLKAPKVVIGLVFAWDEVCDQRTAAAQGVRVKNTDGDELVFVNERFRMRRPRAEIIRKIEAMEGIHAAGGKGSHWVLSKPGNIVHARMEYTKIADIRADGDMLVVETNSRERAEYTAKLITATLGDAVGKPQRTESSGDELLKQAQKEQAGRPALAAVPDLGAQEAMAEFKRQTYATWPDEPLPALDGRTARAAVKTAAGRKQVAALLDSMERIEARQPPAARYDVDILRRALGLVR